MAYMMHNAYLFFVLMLSIGAVFVYARITTLILFSSCAFCPHFRFNTIS